MVLVVEGQRPESFNGREFSYRKGNRVLIVSVQYAAIAHIRVKLESALKSYLIFADKDPVVPIRRKKEKPYTLTQFQPRPTPMTLPVFCPLF